MKRYRKTSKYSGDPGDGTMFKTFISLTDDETSHIWFSAYHLDRPYDLIEAAVDDPIIAKMYEIADPGNPGSSGPGRPWVSRPILRFDERAGRIRAIISQRVGLDV